MLLRTCVALVALACTPASALWPVPRDVSLGDEVLFIEPTVKVTYNGKSLPTLPGYTHPPGANFNSRNIVRAGVSRAFKAIFKDNIVPWMLSKPHTDFEPELPRRRNRVQSIDIIQTQEDDKTTFRPLAGEVDESYNLTLTSDGKATIRAASSTGCLYGLETFLQLFFEHSSGNAWYTPHAPVSIDDSPEFPHRGVLMDTSRHWFSVDDIKRTIDALSWNKMNRLHFHVTDSQSWPLEIPSLPLLSERGSYRKGLTYSPADIASIYEYGIHRGVEVIMEIDMPSHIGIIDLAYEDIVVAYNIQPYQWYCAQPPCGALRMNSTRVYDFLDKLFDDILPRVAPYSAYWHTGGDEVNRNDSMLDPDVRSNSTEVLAPLLQRFLNYAHGKVREYGMTPFVWEEMITDWDMDLGKDVVVQSWLGGSAIKDLAEAGHKAIDSNYNFWYLDCGRGAWLNFGPDVFDEFYPFNDWCGPTKSWPLVYQHDPRAGLSEEAAKNVLGGEVAVWAESIDPNTLDSIIWPRASAAGEVLWSGRVDASGNNRTQLDATPRLSELRERMVARGVRAAAFTQQFCTQGGNDDCRYLAV